MAWADEVEMTAPEEDTAKAWVAIFGATRHDREVSDDTLDGGTYGTTDYRIVLRSFGGDHTQAGRAMRTLEKQGRIKWESSGRIRIPGHTDPEVREPWHPTPVIPPGSPEIHGPFGREEKQEPELQPLTGVVLPPSASEHPWNVRDVHAPVLGPEKPPAATEKPNPVADAAQQVLDNLSTDEPI